MKFVGIIALAKNRVIGKDNKLPWYHKEDLKFFRKTTTGGQVIMGHKTWLGMGVPYLSNRVIWVMMRNNTYGWLQMGYPQGGHANMVNIVTRVEDLPDGDYFVAGGASIYTAFMPHISEFYVTYLKHDYEGDTVMPAFEEPFKQEEVIFENDNMTIKRLYNRQDVLNISVP